MTLWLIGYPTVHLSPHPTPQEKGKGRGAIAQQILQKPLKLLERIQCNIQIVLRRSPTNSKSDFSSIVPSCMEHVLA